MRHKVFSKKEANELIQTLIPLLESLAEKKKKMVHLHDQLLTLELINEKIDNFYETKDGQEYLSNSSELEEYIISFEKDIQKVNSFGCILRDIEKGIIDFYHVVDDQVIFLNWKLGESEIAYWHEVDKSFHDRQTLDQLVRN